MPHLAISLFGPVVVKLDGATVSGFISKKAQALLVYLAVEAGRPHSRDELAGLLWPDYPDAAARTSLRSVLANVRRVLGERHAARAFLTIVGETLQFNQPSDHHVDVAVFDRLRPAGTVDSQAAHLLEAAVAGVKGPFMAGFSLADSPPFEEWMLLKREYFGRQVAAARRQLASHWLAQGACAQALAHAQNWAALEPWQEEAHQLVMRILARDGRRGDALRYFDSCCRILSAELGLGPSEETIALADEIRRGAPAPAGQAGPKRLTSKHLPIPLTPLVGRDLEVWQLAGLLCDPKQRLVTIVGPGGMGKTHLALVVAGDLSAQFPDGAAMVSLAPLQAADEMVTTVAEALGFQFYVSAPPEQMSLDDRLWFTAIRALPLAALYAVSQERAETAVELYALASSVQHIANSSWFEDVAGRHVTAAAQALPAAVVCAAQERGRTRDLWQTIEEVLQLLLQDA